MGERTNLKTIREEQGLSREELGRLVGRTGEQIRRYERGDQDLTLRVARRIALVLGITIEEIDIEDPDQEAARS
jgi:transcriptional regulator with XRE-family HTH domain